MSQQSSKTQFQVRIDTKTKKQASKILDNLGLDMSTAVRIFFKQIVNFGTFPLEIRDENGFRTEKSFELKQSIVEAEKNKKTFSSAKSLLKDLS